MKFNKRDLKGLSHALLLAIEWQIEKCMQYREKSKYTYLASRRVNMFRRLRKAVDTALISSKGRRTDA